MQFSSGWKNDYIHSLLEAYRQRQGHKKTVIKEGDIVLLRVGNIIFCFVDSPKSETLLWIRDARPILEMID